MLRPSSFTFAKLLGRRYGTKNRKAFISGFTDIIQHDRAGFGSFHSEDIECLIRKRDEDYQRPEIYAKLVNKVASEQQQWDEPTPFGSKSSFGLDRNWDFINHGAFGAVMTPLLHESHEWRTYCEKQPLRFFDRELLPLIAYTLREVGKFINCPPSELLPLQNVTSGLNSILQSVVLEKGDEVVCLSLTYGSTKKMLMDLCHRKGAVYKMVDLPLPVISEEDVIDRINRVLNNRTRLVIIDHITSNTAMVLPTLQIASLCKQYGALVIVDAAHALLSQEVSIYKRHPYPSSSETGDNHKVNKGKSEKAHDHVNDGNDSIANIVLADVVDVWLTNGHKWLSAPRGCAFMWVAPTMLHQIRPAIISHGFEPAIVSCVHAPTGLPYYGHIAPGKVLSGFSWDGCRDYFALLTVPSAIRLWQRKAQEGHTVEQRQRQGDRERDGGGDGLNSVRLYCREVLRSAEQDLRSEWCVGEELFAAPVSMRQTSPMTLVPLPCKISGVRGPRLTDREAFNLQEHLHHEHRIEVPIKCLEGRLYARLSAHIYNRPEDYGRLASVIKRLAL